MKYTPRPFDNSDEAIEALKQEHEEAQEFVHGWLKHVGLEGCGSGLDFDDIFHLMSEYKLRLQEQLKPEGVPFESMTKQQKIEFNSIDSKRIMMLFDNGDVCRFDEDHPVALMLATYFLPEIRTSLDVTQLTNPTKVCTLCNNSTDELMNFGLGKDICQDCFNEFEAWRKAKGKQ